MAKLLNLCWLIALAMLPTSAPAASLKSLNTGECHSTKDIQTYFAHHHQVEVDSFNTIHPQKNGEPILSKTTLWAEGDTKAYHRWKPAYIIEYDRGDGCVKVKLTLVSLGPEPLRNDDLFETATADDIIQSCQSILAKDPNSGCSSYSNLMAKSAVAGEAVLFQGIVLDKASKETENFVTIVLQSSANGKGFVAISEKPIGTTYSVAQIIRANTLP